MNSAVISTITRWNWRAPQRSSKPKFEVQSSAPKTSSGSADFRLSSDHPATILTKSCHFLGGGGRFATDGTHYEYGVMPWRENACGLRDGVPRSLDPGAHEARISDNPLRIPPLFSHYPATIWSQLSDSHCITASFRRLQTPGKSTLYARSPVKSGFQRSLRKSRTILPIAVQNLLTLLPVSFYWSFYWRSPPQD